MSIITYPTNQLTKPIFVSLVVLTLFYILRGIGEIQVDSNAFLLLEKISHTLATQHKVWAFQKKMMVKNKFMRTRNRKRTSSLWNERIEVAMDLANVMSYLHNLE